jgi:hypothetical protein
MIQQQFFKGADGVRLAADVGGLGSIGNAEDGWRAAHLLLQS